MCSSRYQHPERSGGGRGSRSDAAYASHQRSSHVANRNQNESDDLVIDRERKPQGGSSSLEYFQKPVSGGKSSASLWKVFNRCSLNFSATSFSVQASKYILFLSLIVQSNDCYLVEQVFRCIGQCIPNASEMHMQFAIMQYANMQYANMQHVWCDAKQWLGSR